MDPLREHRLYQASFLLRDYGFDLEEMPFLQSGNLPLPIDPKLAWAQQSLSEKPLEINKAERRELLRIPGIGPKGAEAILNALSNEQITRLGCTAKIGNRGSARRSIFVIRWQARRNTIEHVLAIYP